jgi:hypothetical protein
VLPLAHHSFVAALVVCLVLCVHALRNRSSEDA